MTPAARDRWQVRAPVLFLSAAGWILLAVAPGGATFAHCLVEMPSMIPPASLASGWALMLAAMMAPLLIAPVRHVRDRSFAHRRARAIALFVAGYGAVWMAAGALLLAIAWAIRFALLAALLATLWQCSPWKQVCLNRGHAHAELAAFAPAADWDALRFGLAHGVWCAGSCWALMLVPLLVSRGHLAAMAAVSVWLYAERLDRPMMPRWHLRLPAKAARILAANARALGFEMGLLRAIR